jgi:hypothetical protein
MQGQSTDGLPAGGCVYNAIIAGERVEKRLLTTAASKARDNPIVPLSMTEPRRLSRHVRASLLHKRDRWLTRALGWCGVKLPRARLCLARASSVRTCSRGRACHWFCINIYVIAYWMPTASEARMTTRSITVHGTYSYIRDHTVLVGARGQPGRPLQSAGADPAAEQDVGFRGAERTYDSERRVRRVVRLRRLLRPRPRLRIRLGAALGKNSGEAGGRERGHGLLRVTARLLSCASPFVSASSMYAS